MRFDWIALVALNAVLLVVAQVLIGSRILLAGTGPQVTGDNDIPTTALVNDNLFNTAWRLSDVSAFWLCGVVMLLSGVWPYLKLFGTALTMHLAVSDQLDKAKSCRVLTYLEMSGKAAYAYILLVALYVSIFTVATPRYTLLHTHVQCTVGVYFGVGVALLVAGTIMSSFLTTNAARSILSEVRMEVKTSENSSLKDAMRQRLRARAAQGLAPSLAPSKPPPTWRCTATAVSAALALGLLLLLGWLPMIHFDRDGFLGKLSGRSHIDISLMNAATASWDAATLAGARSPLFVLLTIFLFIICVVAPALEFLALAVCGVMTRRREIVAAEGWYVRASWCNSLDAISVILITVLAVQCDIEKLVAANFTYTCPDYRLVMNERNALIVGGIGYATSSQCFLVESNIEVGYAVVVIIAILRGIAWFSIRGVFLEKALPLADEAAKSDRALPSEAAGAAEDEWANEF